MSEHITLHEELKAIQTAIAVRILAESQRATEAAKKPPDQARLITAEEASGVLAVTPTWLYRHAKKLPFTRRLSQKALRFSDASLRHWQSTRST